MNGRDIDDLPVISASIRKILQEESRGIKESRERVFFLCNNNNGHGDIFSAKISNDSTLSYIDDSVIEKKCGIAGGTIIHTHGVASGLPSSIDWMTYKEKFVEMPLVKMMCSTGIDGVFCVDRDGKKRARMFTPDEKSSLMKSTAMKRWTGDVVFCDKISREPDVKLACSIQRETGEKEDEVLIGIFDELLVAGGISTAGERDADIAMFTPDMDREIECFGAGEGNVKRLACVVKDAMLDFVPERR
jgi:hypothetical protein